MGVGGVGGWGCTPIVIGGAEWRHHDVTGLNFYISGCDLSSRHHFFGRRSLLCVRCELLEASNKVEVKVKRVCLIFKRRYVCCIF